MSDHLDHLDHVRRDVDRVATLAAAPGALDRPVPACPGWTVRDLVGHLGWVHRMVTGAVVEQRPPGRAADRAPDDPGALVAWLRDGADAMLAVLARDPAEPAWSFDPLGGTVGFWRRRQAMENVVHRVDAEQAAGVRTPVDPALAADGVDEVVGVMVRLRVAEGSLVLPAGAVTLHATDTGATWVVGHGEPAARVDATAENLFLAVWKRLDPAALTDDADALRLLRLPLTP